VEQVCGEAHAHMFCGMGTALGIGLEALCACPLARIIIPWRCAQALSCVEA